MLIDSIPVSASLFCEDRAEKGVQCFSFVVVCRCICPIGELQRWWRLCWFVFHIRIIPNFFRLSLHTSWDSLFMLESEMTRHFPHFVSQSGRNSTVFQCLAFNEYLPFLVLLAFRALLFMLSGILFWFLSLVPVSPQPFPVKVWSFPVFVENWWMEYIAFRHFWSHSWVNASLVNQSKCVHTFRQ